MEPSEAGGRMTTEEARGNINNFRLYGPEGKLKDAIDTILAAYAAEKARADEATQEAKRQRERADEAEAEVDRLYCLLTPEQVDAELNRLGIDVTPAWKAIKAILDATEAAGLPAKGAADASQS